MDKIIEQLPELAKGGAWLVLAAVLIWIIWTFLDRMENQDTMHRSERKEADRAHLFAMRQMTYHHNQERREWHAKFEAQGEKIANAITSALRNGRD